ncbi:fimbrial protein [Serratia sp. 1D1416]|uniref:fimbrial protein n=1 Tax=Serratia sp. 1D1416 TaxID=2447890 RepID=UPI001013CB86|nr:fimbrial protein [Serratia sp. 1D1416]
MIRQTIRQRLQGRLRAGIIALLWAPVLAAGPFVSAQAAGGTYVHMYGALVSEPCVIPPGEDEITLGFGTVVEKFLYKYSRTPAQPFFIHLAECDLSLGSTVRMTFLGTESAALPGLLAMDAGSGAKGIAIGIETPEAKAVKINKASDKFALQAGDNRIPFRAWVQGEPQAITQQKITPGAFSATATFALEYE